MDPRELLGLALDQPPSKPSKRKQHRTSRPPASLTEVLERTAASMAAHPQASGLDPNHPAAPPSRLLARHHAQLSQMHAAKVDEAKLAWGDVMIRALSAVDDDALDDLPANLKIWVAGVASDKWLALQGMPSVVIGHLHQRSGELDVLREALLAEVERRRALNAVTVEGETDGSP